MVIILIGYMGSGKTSYSKQIAFEMGMKCLDTDQLVEEMEGMTIPEIFRVKGEKYFRDAETRVIDRLSNEDNAVIATGGGLPCYNDNMRRLKEIGTTIYLKADVEELVIRLENSHQKRPLVEGKSHDELLKYVAANLGEREKYYKLADISYDANSRYAKDLMTIINILKK